MTDGLAKLLGRRLRWLRKASPLPARTAAAHAALASFIVLFATELDRELVRRGLLAVPGVVSYFLGGAAILGAVALVDGRRAMTAHLAALASAWPFWLVFLALALLCLGQSFRWSETSLRDATRIGIAGAACAIAAALPASRHFRRRWHRYLAAAFLLYCALLWLDSWQLQTFSPIGWRAAGLGVDPNLAAHLVTLLAAPLLAVRRPMVGFAILWAAGVTVFLTLSRGGLMAFVALAGGYGFAFGRRRGWRQGGGMLVGVLTCVALGCWAGTQTLPVFTAHEGKPGRLAFTIDPRRWVTPVPRTRSPEMVAPQDEDPVAAFGARAVQFVEAWRAVAAAPWFGYGSGFNVGEGILSHNMLLATWIDYGMAGALGYGALLVAAWIIFVRRRFWPGGFLAGMLTVWSALSHNVLDGRPAMLLLGLTIGLACGSPKAVAPSRQASPPGVGRGRWRDGPAAAGLPDAETPDETRDETRE